MDFRVNGPGSSLSTLGHLSRSQGALGNSIERLSSGLRINRGADDAAGLTISEKLRAQIRGLSKATVNAQDGVSLIQTAEGALNENHAMLNRMRELSIQSQSDALTSSDRIEIQKEVDQLVDEIDRIAITTEFNTKKLLDGSAAKTHASSDGILLQTFEVEGGIDTGDYRVSMQRTTSGVAQVQDSGIQRDVNTGRMATQNTQLRDLESMFDHEGNSHLETPQALTLRGNGAKVDIIMGGSETIEEFSLKIEEAINNSKAEGGLGIMGSSFDYNASDGQFEYTAGVAGKRGELSFSSSEEILNSFSFSITTEAESIFFDVYGKETGYGIYEQREFTTTVSADDTFGVTGGLDFDFDLGVEAQIDGTVEAVDSIQIGSTDVIFTFHDTNGEDNEQASGSISAGVTVILTNNRTFTLTSIQTMVNDAINAANDPGDSLTFGPTSSNYTNPNIAASFSGYNLVLTTTATGTSGTISVQANAAAQSTLGLTNGITSGTGGTAGTLTGGTNITGGVTFAGGGVTRIRVADGDYNTNSPSRTTTDITFNQGVLISQASILTAFNNYFTANNVDAAATVVGGNLVLTASETGSDSRVSITEVGGATMFAALGLASGASNAGAGGAAAILTGSTDGDAATKGFTQSGIMNFELIDGNGDSSGEIYLGTENVDGTGESFTISTNQITSIIDASNMSSTAIDYGFTNDVLLSFFQREEGGTSSIELDADSADVAIGGPAYGINFDQFVGSNVKEIEFDIRIIDNSLDFEVGANKNQLLNFGVKNSSSEALGLKGIDVTTIRESTSALGKIDEAIERISSERARLGAVQNRLGFLINSNHTTNSNLSRFESSIRDVDLAKETVDFARNQLLSQSGTAQLQQAKVAPQQALQLLG